jgi:hypothetical protein
MLVTKGKLFITLPLRFLVYLCLSLSIVFLSGLLNTTEMTYPVSGNHLDLASITTEYQQLEQEIPGLKKQYTLVGSTLLIIGLLIQFKLYRTVQGIKFLSNQLVFLLDLIVITILAVLGFMGMDYLLAERYDALSTMGQEGLLGLFCFPLILLILPIIISWKSARGLLINEKGILDSDLILQTFIPWNELGRMELMDDQEFSGRRRTYKVLFLHTRDENAITISGNIPWRAKEKIKKLLLQHVPEDKKVEMKICLSAL